jgi:hypothetical protein
MQLSYSARAFVRSFLKHISWLLFTIGITSIVCMAQIDRAALTGTVTDPTGAMVQHAEVQAVDLATGLKSEAQTNSKACICFRAWRSAHTRLPSRTRGLAR